MRFIITILAITFFVSFSFAVPVLSEPLNIKLHCKGEHSNKDIIFGTLTKDQVNDILTIKDGKYSFAGQRHPQLGNIVVLIGKGKVKTTSNKILLIDEKSRTHTLVRNTGAFSFSPSYFQTGSLISSNITCTKLEKKF